MGGGSWQKHKNVGYSEKAHPENTISMIRGNAKSVIFKCCIIGKLSISAFRI